MAATFSLKIFFAASEAASGLVQVESALTETIFSPPNKSSESDAS